MQSEKYKVFRLEKVKFTSQQKTHFSVFLPLRGHKTTRDFVAVIKFDLEFLQAPRKNKIYDRPLAVRCQPYLVTESTRSTCLAKPHCAHRWLIVIV